MFFLNETPIVTNVLSPRAHLSLLKNWFVFKIDTWVVFFFLVSFFGWEAIRICLLKKWRGMLPVLFN